MLKKYLLKSLSSTFFPIFLTLFSITSIIFLVKIASLTSIIQLDIYELLLLYSFAVPKILFYTLPVSFIFSLSIALAKLSSEYELLVISSFGQKPLKIINIFLPLAITLSIILFIISMVVIPKANFLNQKFIQEKKAAAKFNIKASQFGQEFGEWLIFIKDDKDKLYNDVKLLRKNDSSDQFIIANSATIKNETGDLNLILNKGKSFVISDNIEQIDYSTMAILDSHQNKIFAQYQDPIKYWSNIQKNKGLAEDFSFNILVSIFPLISLLFMLVFGYFNPRYEKNRAVLYTGITLVFFFIFIKQAININPFLSIYIIPIFWIFISYILYSKTVKELY